MDEVPSMADAVARTPLLLLIMAVEGSSPAWTARDCKCKVSMEGMEAGLTRAENGVAGTATTEMQARAVIAVVST